MPARMRHTPTLRGRNAKELSKSAQRSKADTKVSVEVTMAAMEIFRTHGFPSRARDKENIRTVK